MVKMFSQAYKGVSVEFYVRVCEYAYDVSVWVVPCDLKKKVADVLVLEVPFSSKVKKIF